MGNWIKNDWGKILILIPILAILIGCGRIAFVFEFGYPLSLKERDFTVEDPTDQRELAFAFIHSVAFHKIDGIKLQVDPSQQDDLERLTAQIEPANKRCRIPFDQVLSYSSGSYLKETISIEYK